MYRTGTVSIPQGSKTLTGSGTQWLTVANILAGYLITFDESRFYEITSVGSDTSLQLESLIDGLGYQGETLTNAKYVITFPLQSGIASNIALNQLKLQEKWQQRERDISGWMSTDDTTHLVESYTGNKVSIISLQELTRLINAGQYPGANAWLDGNGAPDNSIGGDGAFYLDTSTGDIYRKSSTEWSLLMTIAGGSGSGGGLTESEVLAITHPSLSANILNTLVSLNQGVASLGQADTAQTQALSDAISSVKQGYESADNQISSDYKQADNSLEQTLRDSLASLTDFTAAVNQLREDVRKSGSANNSLMAALPFNHEHPTHLKFQLSNSRPLTRAKSAGLIHFDTGMSDLWFSKGFEMDDWVKLDKSIGRRKFLVLENQHYIALDSPFTGDVTIRVWPFQNGSSGLPSNSATNGLTMGSWQQITFSVTDLEQLFRDGTSSVTYFYGLVDFVRIGQAFDSLDTGSSRLSAIGGNIEKTTGWAGLPLIDFTLENDGYWYSGDLTEGLPESVSSGWNNLGGNAYSCSSINDAAVIVKSLANSESEGKTLEVALRVVGLSGVLSITASNNDDYRIFADGTYRFSTVNEDIALKRAFGNLTIRRVEVLYVRMKVNS